MKSAVARAFAGKRVLLTGHTGFKGGWLALWLTRLGAEVAGYALAPPTTPALFELVGIEDRLDHRIGDVRDGPSVTARVAEVAPDVIFHLAAQPIVRESYQTPVETLETNVTGTAHVLEAVRTLGRPCAIVVITSDKCYQNNEWVWGYRENDPLGGNDPYSMSKGAAELVVHCWRASFFNPNGPVRLASARAGNVIGGGDWAADRILTDSVTALSEGRSIAIRNPRATRPWQHVLEPLSGYLWLAARLMDEDGGGVAESWNFGPGIDSARPVGTLVDLITRAWGEGTWHLAGSPEDAKEAMNLGLSCDKAFQRLGWRATWSLDDAVANTVAWYRAWHDGHADLAAITLDQIAAYEAAAAVAGQPWASPVAG